MFKTIPLLFIFASCSTVTMAKYPMHSFVEAALYPSAQEMREKIKEEKIIQALASEQTIQDAKTHNDAISKEIETAKTSQKREEETLLKARAALKEAQDKIEPIKVKEERMKELIKNTADYVEKNSKSYKETVIQAKKLYSTNKSGVLTFSKKVEDAELQQKLDERFKKWKTELSWSGPYIPKEQDLFRKMNSSLSKKEAGEAKLVREEEILRQYQITSRAEMSSILSTISRKKNEMESAAFGQSLFDKEQVEKREAIRQNNKVIASSTAALWSSS